MPSIADVANEVKALLEDVKTNTATTATRLQQTNTKLNALMAIDQAGFVNLSQGIAVMIDRQKEANHLLDVNREQNDAMLCWLAILADLSCRQLRRLNTLIEVEQAIGADTRELAAITELVHGTETIEVTKQRELSVRIDECCPPPKEPPESCYEPCETPRYDPYKPSEQDFEPLPQERIG